MPANSLGKPGLERVTRFESATRRHDIGTGTEVIEYCSADLIPGIEISAGFGRFQPAGRLPAHLHDFDESITIIGGEATCVVQGRRHPLKAGATAMVPRGRVHCFVNESTSPMEMVWAYAGPLPERFVVTESFATQDESNAT